jgi:LPS-assembly lipoprotein
MSSLDQYDLSLDGGGQVAEGDRVGVAALPSSEMSRVPPHPVAPPARLGLSLRGRGVARLAAAALVAIGVSACFRPLYGPTASGVPLQETFASIQVEPVNAPVGQERLTHYLRSELVFDLDGSGQPRQKQYKLAIGVEQNVVTPIVDSVSGRAQSANLNAQASYKLTTLDGSRTLASGTASASASYERFIQRFANVRAARDAEMRVAKLLSEQIKTRLAGALVGS